MQDGAGPLVGVPEKSAVGGSVWVVQSTGCSMTMSSTHQPSSLSVAGNSMALSLARPSTNPSSRRLWTGARNSHVASPLGLAKQIEATSSLAARS